MMVSNQDPVLTLLREASTKRVFPGAVLCASRHGEVRYDHAIGAASLFPIPLPLVSQALFDVASLTKNVATTAALMLLVDAGELEIDIPIAEYIPAMKDAGKTDITVRHLLAHSSGLPAHIKFYEELEALRAEGKAPSWGPESVDWVIDKIAQVDAQAPNQVTIYSDLGFILLGRMIEHITEKSLDTFCQEEIFLPLGLEDTFFLPLFDETLRKKRLKGRQVVVTEQCPWRGRLLSGEVHDDNCHAMGGVAGHAGLFSTASDLHRFAFSMQQCAKGVASFLSPAVVNEFWRIQDKAHGAQEGVEGTSRTLGWDTPTPGISQAGEHFSASSVGHLGFTGCSMWIDRDEEIIAILLTNRVHPSRDNDAIKTFRPRLHNALHTLLKRPAPLPPPSEEGTGELPQQQEAPNARSFLPPPPQPVPFAKHLLKPEDGDDGAPSLPVDEFATSLDLGAKATPAPLAPTPDDEQPSLEQAEAQASQEDKES